MGKGACLRPGCTKPAKAHGLCNSDLNTVYKLIKKGETSWEELTKAGKASEVVRGKVKRFFQGAGK